MKLILVFLFLCSITAYGFEINSIKPKIFLQDNESKYKYSNEFSNWENIPKICLEDVKQEDNFLYVELDINKDSKKDIIILSEQTSRFDKSILNPLFNLVINNQKKYSKNFRALLENLIIKKYKINNIDDEEIKKAIYRTFDTNDFFSQHHSFGGDVHSILGLYFILADDFENSWLRDVNEYISPLSDQEIKTHWIDYVNKVHEFENNIYNSISEIKESARALEATYISIHNNDLVEILSKKENENLLGENLKVGNFNLKSTLFGILLIRSAGFYENILTNNNREMLVNYKPKSFLDRISLFAYKNTSNFNLDLTELDINQVDLKEDIFY
jgi:hypothetical protein